MFTETVKDRDRLVKLTGVELAATCQGCDGKFTCAVEIDPEGIYELYESDIG